MKALKSLSRLTETELATVSNVSPNGIIRRIAALWLKARMAHMAGDYYTAALIVVTMKEVLKQNGMI